MTMTPAYEIQAGNRVRIDGQVARVFSVKELGNGQIRLTYVGKGNALINRTVWVGQAIDRKDTP